MCEFIGCEDHWRSVVELSNGLSDFANLLQREKAREADVAMDEDMLRSELTATEVCNYHTVDRTSRNYLRRRTFVLSSSLIHESHPIIVQPERRHGTQADGKRLLRLQRTREARAC